MMKNIINEIIFTNKNGASIKYGRKKVTAMYPKIENEMTCTQNNKEVNPLIMFSCFDSTWV
nr:hypothetical protein [Kordia sp.]